MPKNVGVKEWVAMFREIGLDDAAMKKWHHAFETRHPEGHQGFLEWLGLPKQDIDAIRAKHK